MGAKGVETMHALARTVRLAVSRWDGTSSRAYQVRMVWRVVLFSWGGVVRAEPVSKRKVRIAYFSCY